MKSMEVKAIEVKAISVSPKGSRSIIDFEGYHYTTCDVRINLLQYYYRNRGRYQKE